MSSWITIYLKQPLQNLSIEGIKSGISPADWWTLGEDFNIEQEAVDDFMQSLVWTSLPMQVGLEGSRPIQIHLWNAADRVAEERKEIMEKALPEAVTEHLQEVGSIVALEFGHSQLRTMYEVLAFEIAYWLAEAHEGVISAPDECWYDHDKHRWQPIS